MRNRNTPETSGQQASEIDTDADRFPTATSGLRRLIQEGSLPDGPVERLEVRWLANGEGVYRVWPARAEEPEGGYVPPASPG